MRYLSVCSGIEAVSIAWQPLGWQPAMFAEIDPFCAWLLRSRYGASRPQHMPNPNDAPNRKEAKQRAAAIRNVVALPADGAIVNAGDFTKIGADDAGAIDLLAGGTPCQSFSVAGKRAGLDDPRGNLTIEFARLAGRLRPLWLVWENVPGVLSIDDGRTFGAFLGMLVQLGYGIAYRVLDAQHFGVPQRRRRVFVVGHLGDWRGPAAVLLERHSLSGYPPPRRETRKDVAPTLSARAHGGGGPGTDFDLSGGLIPSTGDTSHCLNAGGMGRQDFETETLITHALSADGFDASEDGTGRGTPMVPVAICTAHTQSNGSGFSDDVAHTLENGGAQAVAFAQNTRDEVRLHGGDGNTVGALAAQRGAKQQSYIAFSAKDYGADADNIAPTLRGMGHDRSHANGGGQVAIAFAQNQDGDVLSGDVMQSLGTNSNATGRNAPTIAFTLHGSDGTASVASSTETAGSLRTRAPGSIENSSTTAVLQEQSVSWSGELTASTDVAGTLQRGGEGGRVDGVMTPQMAVRRLTPRECERLQGFPADYTLVEYRGKMAADGPRYKALGNSMAVPVMHWIGRRIAAVDQVLRDRPGDERIP
ncbi:DNA cytosine methyltransferase [Granulicella sp. L60]|uniref:DNA cytosine methyltransferase n=1 Tax=Granulicella sp. L60 TaxID=1641866 RepID=UPI001C207770|nr:DNA cytosine methyltransferase [Granulicella sp. L60]